MKTKTSNRYHKLLERLFFERYRKGQSAVSFEREDLVSLARDLTIKLPKNIGDVIYSARYRAGLPEKILATQPEGSEWVIEGAGRAKYEFRLVPINRVAPNPILVTIKIPDATPEIVEANALSDEQALLAKVRYNRLIDIFLGITAFSLQNHLRTTVESLGQIEIDEIYVGLDRRGCQYVIPVQAKGGNDRLSTVQAKQDIACCATKFPNLVCRSVSAQFMGDSKIAMFALEVDEHGSVRIAEERHYCLVQADQITASDLKNYRGQSKH